MNWAYPENCWVQRNQESSKGFMKFLVLLLVLMMIMDIPERSGVLNGVLDGLHMLWASFVQNLVKICWVWWYQGPSKTLFTLLRLVRIMDIPDWGWCPWWHFVCCPNAQRSLCWKFGWNLLTLSLVLLFCKLLHWLGPGSGLLWVG